MNAKEVKNKDEDFEFKRYEGYGKLKILQINLSTIILICRNSHRDQVGK